jgi:hypothetical protein
MSPATACATVDREFGVEQELGVTLADDTEYELTVSVGRRDGFVGTYGAWRIQLLAGSSVRANLSADDVMPAPPSGTFSDVSVSFVSASSDPDSGEPLWVRLMVDPATMAGDYADFDNVRVTADSSPISVSDHGFEEQRNEFEGNPGSVVIPILGGPWVAVGAAPGGRFVGDPIPQDEVYTSPRFLNSEPSGGVFVTEGGNGMDGPNMFFMCDPPIPGCPVVTRTYGVEQALGAVVADDTEYQLTVAVGHRDGTGGTYGGWGIQLLAGDTLLDELFSNDPKDVTRGHFRDVAVSYHSLASGDPNLGKPLKVRLLFDPNLGGDYADFDNIRLPEPQVPTMLASGIALLCALVRRRRRMAAAAARPCPV